MKLLFFSPFTLLDSSSGAALCVNALLAELVAQGHSCVAVTGSVVDAPNGLFAKALKAEPVTRYVIQNTGTALAVRRIEYNGVVHFIAGGGESASDMLAVEDVALRRLFLDSFKQLEPDALLTYGGFTSNLFAGQHALSKGRKSVLYAASESYARGAAHQFDHVNMIHTVSGALCKRLETVTDLPKVATQTFVRRADVVSARHSPEYIMFINPLPWKGLRIAAALVRECARRQKPYKFLFVDGRGTRTTALQACPELAGLENLSFADNAADVRPLYERMAVCLYPSVYFEAAGRIPIEANANGIPVLACASGGIPEMLDGAGFLFDPPEESRRTYDAPVAAEYVDPWITVIDRLHTDPAFMADAVQRAKAADSRYDPARMARTFAAAVGA